MFSNTKKFLCQKCKKVANIKINTISYCNACFVSNFQSKIERNLPKIPANATVLIYLGHFTSSLTAIDTICKFLSNRPIRNIQVYSKSSKVVESLRRELPTAEDISGIDFCVENERFIKRSGSDVIKYCISNAIDILLYCQSMNQVISGSLELLCSSAGARCLDEYRTPEEQLKTVNLLDGIKEKEIVYYCHLCGIPRITNVSSRTPVQDILDDFLHQTDHKNGLALFNVQGVLKSLSADITDS